VSYEPGNPFQGVCQGNVAGPAIWIFVSLMLVRFMHRLGMVREIQSYISGVVLLLMGFMFVDNIELEILGEYN